MISFSVRCQPWLPALILVLVPGLAFGQQSSGAKVAEQVNKKMVKLYGAGGLRGMADYGSGIIVSPKGYVLTVASTILDTPEVAVHLSDGRKLKGKVLVVEPELDAALIKINLDESEKLPYFDVAQAAKAPVAQTGDWIQASGNPFNVATRDEPMSVLHGVIAAYTKVYGHKGISNAPYQGKVYVIDAITNNPGAGGGALTSRKGELLGLIGKELKNSLTDTWINYAVPIQFLGEFVEKGMAGKYEVKPHEKLASEGGYHGIVLVPNVVETTPPFVETVQAESPAAKAGLKPDDLIVYVDGEQVVSVEAFKKLMDRIRPGTQVTLEIRRSDKNEEATDTKLMTLKLVVAEKPKKDKPK